MKGLILLHLALFIFFSVNSQESSINNLLISISWEEDYIQKKVKAPPETVAIKNIV